MSYSEDPRLQTILKLVSECIADNESNEIILMGIQKFFSGTDCTQLIDNRLFVHNFFLQFIRESLVNSGTPSLWTIDGQKLSNRSKVLSKFVHNYREYQLNLILVLCEIKIQLDLEDSLFDEMIKIFHTNGVISEDAFNHWSQSRKGFEYKMEVIRKCCVLLEMSQEAREDHFFANC